MRRESVPRGWPPRIWRSRRHLLRTARLNAVGWSALVGSCVAAGSVGWLATTPWAPLRPSVTAAAVAGSAAVPLVAVVVADRRRWSRIESGFSWTSDIAELYRAARALRDRGIAVTVDPDRPCLRFHAKDRRRVAACLTELGYPAPPT